MVVLVVNWNGHADTTRCLESLSSLPTPHRVLVIDNGSSDGSVERLRDEWPVITVLPLPGNIGFGRAANAGIRHMAALGWSPDFVWLLNNDAVVAPGCLDAMLRIADADPSVGIVGSVLLDADGSDRVQAWGGGRVNRWLGTTRTYRAPDGGDLTHIVGASMLLRVSMLERIGLFDERYFFYLEDTELSYRAHRSGWRLAVADTAIVRHRHGASVNDGSTRRGLRSDRYYARGSAIFMASHVPAYALPAVFAVRVSALVVRRAWRREGVRSVVLLREFAAGTRSGLGPAMIPHTAFVTPTAETDGR